ncbi:MAG: cellulase family glycosylhydrolase [Gaiellaceae bacterium]|jgi:hypothetical protein
MWGSLVLIVASLVAGSATGAQKMQTIKGSSGPLATGMGFLDTGSDAENTTEAERIAAAGATIVRIPVLWAGVAPTGATLPTGFNPRDPADPMYRWAYYDNEVKAVSDAGLQPMLSIYDAPTWAQGSGGVSYLTGSYKPSATALADFSTAIAERYSGSFESLPKVKYWEVWNEPNLNGFLSPQTVKGKPFAPGWYRSMLNAASNAYHAVDPRNVVIAGDTAPFGGSPGVEKTRTMPLFFMERVLCIGEKRVRNKRTRVLRTVYRSTCKSRSKFDVWAHHPYTEGGPTVKARIHGDVSLGDMNEMRMALNKAISANHVGSAQRVRLWVTEFSWDTAPADPKGVPLQMHARWVAQCLYQMWKTGVSLVAWLQIRDLPFPESYYQSGLYSAGPSGINSDKPKPGLRAFRFPFVALTGKNNFVTIWGRTPSSRARKIIVERKSGAKWKRVKTLKANRYGIFQTRIRKPAKTVYLRARLAGSRSASLPFSLIPPKKPWVGCVFGTCSFQGG